MTDPAKSPALKHTGGADLKYISGADLKRFVVRSALLRLIDPVRGEPTRTTFDENPHEIVSERNLKRKFLDSFALICSTSSSGAETASAVCLEEPLSGGAILRVARNRGLTPKDLAVLERVLQILREVAKKEKQSTKAEIEILHLVSKLDRDRILAMVEKVQKLEIQLPLLQLHSRLPAGQAKSETWAKPELKRWLELCPFTSGSLKNCSPRTVTLIIVWASQARWCFPEQLQTLLRLGGSRDPLRLDSLHKIARYHASIKSMLKLAAKQPEVFADIVIQEVEAPEPQPFSLLNEKHPLPEAVKQFVKEDPEMTMEQLMEQLEEHLGQGNVEKVLRKACPTKLTLHAEMQLVVFYDENPHLTPRMPFIGTSKKACFLCHEYLRFRDLRNLQVSACHQKIYSSWMPPPYYPVPGRSKSPAFFKLSKEIERLTRIDIKTSLKTPRRSPNLDSTAGPPLTKSATVTTGLASRHDGRFQFTLGDGSMSEYLEWYGSGQL